MTDKMNKEFATDLVKQLNDMIQHCEGAMMAAKGGDYLHNFSCMIQCKLRDVRDQIGYEGGCEE